MLKIRLQRVGRKHEPAFRLVLTDSKNSTKSGKFLEVLGNHDFRLEKNTKLNKDRILHWIKVGAQPSDTAHNLLIVHKIITGKKINVLPKKTVAKKEEPVVEAKAPVAPKVEAPVVEESVPEVKVEEVAPVAVETEAPEAEAKVEEAPTETPAN